MNKYLLVLSIIVAQNSLAQMTGEVKTEVEKGFKKENLFTGGGVTLQFNNGFTGGVNPVLGYSLTRWIDAGLVFNYTYASARNWDAPGDRVRQSIYGGGAFTRIFPVKFLFLQAQQEHNWTHIKYRSSLGITETSDAASNSTLVGGGYTTGRDPAQKDVFFYVSILFDIGSDELSPYVDNRGNPTPIYRAGIHIPLFQGKRNR